jgi:hypothetical protein
MLRLDDNGIYLVTREIQSSDFFHVKKHRVTFMPHRGTLYRKLLK